MLDLVERQGFSCLTKKVTRAHGSIIRAIWNAAGGAGVQAGQAVVNSGADVYIGPQLGPKAMSVLSMSKVQLFEGVPGKTVEENIELYKAGKLLKIR